MSDYAVLTFWFLYSCIKTSTHAFAVICIKELVIRRGSGVTPDVKVVTSRAILKETSIILDDFVENHNEDGDDIYMMIMMMVVMMTMMVVNLVERLIRKGKDETPSLLSAFTMSVT